MTMEREKALLSEIREMAQMSNTDIAQRVQVPVEGADAYFKSKIVSTMDIIIDELDYMMMEEAQKRNEPQVLQH